MLTLEVIPGQGVGSFYLGMPTSDAIQYLASKISQKHFKTVNKIDVVYDAKEPLNQDIVLNLMDDGLLFRFEPITQRLKMVEVHDLLRVKLKYGNTLFTSHADHSSFVKIYQTFGPTYPGYFDAHESAYYLSYPGITFVFPIPKEFAHLYINSQELPMEFPNRTTPVAIRIYIYQGNDWRYPKLHSLEQTETKDTLPMIKPYYYERVDVELGKGITFTKRSKSIRFHDTPQQVMMNLGAPENIYYKKHDKLSIHGHAFQHLLAHEANAAPSDNSKKQTLGFQKTAIDYFYNYFSLGVDIMFNGCTHTVQKIILHTNFPGSKDFNMYVKCNFSLELQRQYKSLQVTPNIKFAAIQEVLGTTTMSKPLVNDSTVSNNPFGGTRYFATENTIFEVMKNDYLNSITLFIL